jgi:hypothetical protein
MRNEHSFSVILLNLTQCISTNVAILFIDLSTYVQKGKVEP